MEQRYKHPLLFALVFLITLAAAPAAAILGLLLWSLIVAGGRPGADERKSGILAWGIMLTIFYAGILWLVLSGVPLTDWGIPASWITKDLYHVWALNTLLAPWAALIYEALMPGGQPDTQLLHSNEIESIDGEKPPTPEAIDGQAVMGRAVSGALTEWLKGNWFTFPRHTLAVHGAVIGRSGAGKSETLLRVAYLAAKIYDMQVIFIDAKGDWETAARFRHHMADAGHKRVGIFPTTAHNGWLGEPHDTLNKLIECQMWTEDFYKGVATNMLMLALNAPGLKPPTNSRELLRRLNPQVLKQIYKGRPELSELSALKDDVGWGVFYRYASFFRAVRGKLDGKAGFGSWDSTYFLLDGVRLQEEAARLGQFLITDFEQFLAIRKHANPDRRVLIIIDELSAIIEEADPTGLFERIRSLGASVMVSSQSYEGLGENADRILATAATIILHACVLPEELVAAAGERFKPEIAYSYAAPSLGHGDDGAPLYPSMMGKDEQNFGVRTARKADYNLRPEEVQQLPVGRCYFIFGGNYEAVDVSMLEFNKPEIKQLEAQLYDEYLRSQSEHDAHFNDPNGEKKKKEKEKEKTQATPQISAPKIVDSLPPEPDQDEDLANDIEDEDDEYVAVPEEEEDSLAEILNPIVPAPVEITIGADGTPILDLNQQHQTPQKAQAKKSQVLPTEPPAPKGVARQQSASQKLPRESRKTPLLLQESVSTPPPSEEKASVPPTASTPAQQQAPGSSSASKKRKKKKSSGQGNGQQNNQKQEAPPSSD